MMIEKKEFLFSKKNDQKLLVHLLSFLKIDWQFFDKILIYL